MWSSVRQYRTIEKSRNSRFSRSKNHKTRFRATCRFLCSGFSPFPTKNNRLAIWSIFLEKPIGWRCRFRCKFRCGFFLSKSTSLVITRSLMQEPQPYRIDARGRAQAEVGLLLGLAHGQAGVEASLYVWSCGGSSHSSHKAAI